MVAGADQANRFAETGGLYSIGQCAGRFRRSLADDVEPHLTQHFGG
jgi:hypothetical protein